MQLNSKELYQSSGKEKENRCLAFTSSAKRENRKYHVVVVQRRQRNVLKKRDARAKLLFYLSLFSSFCLSPCRRRRCCSSSLTVFCRMQIAMIQFAVRRKTRYNLHTLWLTHTLPSSSDSVTSDWVISMTAYYPHLPDLIYDSCHLCTHFRTERRKAMSRGFSGGKQVIKSANLYKKSRRSLFILDDKKWNTFHLPDDDGKLWVEVF